MMIDSYLKGIRKYLEVEDYLSALNSYLELYHSFPDFFYDSSNRKDTFYRQHISNAANLARKYGYEKFMPARSSSNRISDAIDSFVGLKKQRFQSSLQRPSFFYVPNLETKPFYEVSEIEGLDTIFIKLDKSRSKLISLLTGKKENYVKLMGSVPDKVEWNKLKEDNWSSIHLLRQGKKCVGNDKKIDSLLNVFSHKCIADCPPHAPEAFISELSAGAVIPKHFGLSNVKLTVHFPIHINAKSSLTVADETKYWSPKTAGMVFDDSIQHCASNLGSNARSVLIFDIWNPFLTEVERSAVRHFMVEHSIWHARFGKLAIIDRNI